ncbi:condensation domain-containing protein, partial [Achromobacter xylosoxidans]|uniref:condensation domain-containing protein n=2 Tax=Alcaligenes xylosoxydans xylosoxydans TaxID=85698 RepID=UPI001F12ACAD
MELDKNAIARRYAALTPEKQAKFLEALRAQNLDFGQLPIVPQTGPGRGVLSYAQQRQWFLWRLDPASSAYHITGALRLHGALDTDAVQRAFQDLWRRHAGLRTVFTPTPDGLARQLVRDDVAFSIEQHAAHDDAGLQTALDAFRLRPFDLVAGPLLRVGLWRLGEDVHALALVVHHAVADGWSLQVLLEEFAQRYAAHTQGSAAELPPLPIDLQDHALWQRHWMEAGEAERQLGYWRAHLGGEDVTLELPADTPRREAGAYRAGREHLRVPGTLAQALRARAATHGTTLFAVLLAAYQVLLHRISGAQDLRIGVPLANRARPETQRLVGFLASTQVLRGQLHGGMTLEALIAQARDTVLGAQAHPDLPFEELVDALAPERKAGHSPLFQVMLNHTREQSEGALRLPGIRAEDLALGGQAAQFDLTLNTNEGPDGQLDATLIHAEPLFSAATVAGWARMLLQILEDCAHSPQRRIADVAPLADAARGRLLALGQGGAARPAMSVPQRLAAQALATPD